VTGWPDQRPAYSSSIMPNNLNLNVLWRMKGGGLLDGPSLFSVENGRCIRLPLPGTSDTQRLIYASSHGRALALPGPLILIAQAAPWGVYMVRLIEE
jgi:hypothetical protein